MCDPKPGARCSADTWNELSAAKKRLANLTRELERDPDSAAAQRRVNQATEVVDRKAAAFDSAPRGQKQLEAAISGSAEPSSPENDPLRTRLYVGRSTRINQKMALARSLGKSVDVERLEADKALSRLRHPDGGFTRHPETGREEIVGFFVSPHPDREMAIKVEDLRPSDIRKFRDANRDLFSQPGHFMGGWHDPETGMVSLDVSVKTESAERARELAAENQQVAFFDAQMGNSVDVDTTARDRIAAIHDQTERE
jgi:hypothetical protein